ncbi:hypothetical protein JNO48_00050 [Clostridiales bacterium]|nr:hypothetical protein JNO48_00050 [Clostridiales bacterium]
MANFDKIIEKARKTADEIMQKKTAKAQEIETISAAIKAASAEMEQAALAGDETAYARAKEKRNAAENRMEIIRIQEKKQAGNDDIQNRIFSVMRETESAALDELRTISKEFVSKYEDLCKTAALVQDRTTRYNKLRDYFRCDILKTNDFPFGYLQEVFPVNHITDIERRYNYSVDFVRKAVDNH